MPIHQNKLQLKATWLGPNTVQKLAVVITFGRENFSVQIWFFFFFFLSLSVLQKQLKKKMLNKNHIL